MATSKEIKGPTPNGGDRAIAYYQNDQGEAVDEFVATKVEVVEMDGDREIARTYADLR